MSDIKDKLDALLRHRGLMSGAEWRAQHDALERRRQAGEFEIDKVVPGRLAGEGDDRFYLVRSTFPLDTLHGGVPLGALLNVIPEHIALSACEEDLERFDPATTCFIDAETTGLAGGTGTVAFLVGVGWFTEKTFHLDQCFMRDFDDEEPMLRHLDGLFAACETVVSYNGKTFDVPLLRTRFIANRMRFRAENALHFDLLHAARRFFRERLPDCSLGTVEQTVLGIQRHGDVPSSEIPAIWFDYLRTRDARRLEAVFYHHKMDVLSLVALTAWLSRSLEAPRGEGFEHLQDRLALLRLHFRQRRYAETIETARALLETEAAEPLRRESLELLGFACKRMHDWAAMEAAWEAMLEEFPRDLLPFLELAKHHEHRTRRLDEAERLCLTALKLIDADAWPADPFTRRLERIRRKLARTRPDDSDPL